MMELQADGGNPRLLTLELEFVPEDERDVDPATIDEIGRGVVASLMQDGYTIQPVYTGERGGFLFAIPLVLELVGQAFVANKDLLIELLKTVQPIIVHLFKEGDKHADQATTPHPVKVALKIDGASISVEAPDIGSAEQLMRLASTFRAAHPAVAENVTLHSTVKVTGHVRKRQQRRRR